MRLACNHGMRVLANAGAITSCATCPVGKASDVGRGGVCPLIDRTRAAGEWIYFEGDSAGIIWFIKRGTVALLRATGEDGTADGARALRREGSFLGLEALVRATYLDGARALTEAKLCGASRDAFDAWLGARGTPARTALEQTLLTMCADTPRAAGADGVALRRVARWLLDQPGEEAPPVPRHIVADLLGMVPETFSRSLARLAEMQAIHLTRRTLRVRDHAILAAAAGERIES